MTDKTRTVPPAGAYVVDTKAARSTLTMISVLNLKAKGSNVELGPDGEAWAARCDDHEWMVWTPTRRDAHLEATRPEDWCPECTECEDVEFIAEFEVGA